VLAGCGEAESLPQAADGASLTETVTAMPAEISATTATSQKITSPDVASLTVASPLPTALVVDRS
jgi:uncharacterized lipoprotein YbaY